MTDPAPLPRRFRRNPAAAHSRVGAESVLLHLETGTYFSLDALGTRIWDELDTPVGMDDLADRVAGWHPRVPRSRIVDDLRGFLSELHAAGLLEVAP